MSTGEHQLFTVSIHYFRLKNVIKSHQYPWLSERIQLNIKKWNFSGVGKFHKLIWNSHKIHSSYPPMQTSSLFNISIYFIGYLIHTCDHICSPQAARASHIRDDLICITMLDMFKCTKLNWTTS